MKMPKLLPWYAKKAGVSLERAEVLWRKAERSAMENASPACGSEYWGLAMKAFRQLLAAEQATLCAPLGTPIVRSQLRVWRMPLLALEDMIHAAAANWRGYFGYSLSDSDRKAA